MLKNTIDPDVGALHTGRRRSECWTSAPFIRGGKTIRVLNVGALHTGRRNDPKPSIYRRCRGQWSWGAAAELRCERANGTAPPWARGRGGGRGRSVKARWRARACCGQQSEQARRAATPLPHAGMPQKNTDAPPCSPRHVTSRSAERREEGAGRRENGDATGGWARQTGRRGRRAERSVYAYQPRDKK